ncbi:isochorismatase family protein [Vibrio salinus]|uniref:isochorismatase family protein n=1 Tax=Vibrio salinus TaxID=2899784 RepID=UPI003569BEBA
MCRYRNGFTYQKKNIDNIVIAGIVINMGVESAVRYGWEFKYNMIVVEFACSVLNTKRHQSTFTHLFSEISRVTQTHNLLLEL